MPAGYPGAPLAKRCPEVELGEGPPHQLHAEAEPGEVLGGSDRTGDGVEQGSRLAPGDQGKWSVVPGARTKRANSQVADEDLPKGRSQFLVRGLPGHPLHPPLTGVTIGMFVFATAAAVLGYAGAIPDKAGPASWLALIGGLGFAIPTAATGFVDWLFLEWGSRRWRTATWHLTAMLSAVALFAVAAWRQYPGYEHGDVTLVALIFSLAGLLVLLVGGWLGGSLVFAHGTRVVTAAGQAGPDGDTWGEEHVDAGIGQGRR